MAILRTPVFQSFRFGLIKRGNMVFPRIASNKMSREEIALIESAAR
jgi:hypothetical protein